jgi:hypothetical protein
MEDLYLLLGKFVFINNTTGFHRGTHAKFPQGSNGASSYLSHKQHEPPSVKVSISIARLGSSSSPIQDLVSCILK